MALFSLIILTLICPGYSSSLSIFLQISLAKGIIFSSFIISGLTMILISRPAWIAKHFSTPSKEEATPSSFSRRFYVVLQVFTTSARSCGGDSVGGLNDASYNVFRLNIAMMSLNCVHNHIVSLYFLAMSTPISTWEPSVSWSKALPISWSKPALFAKSRINT